MLAEKGSQHSPARASPPRHSGDTGCRTGGCRGFGRSLSCVGLGRASRQQFPPAAVRVLRATAPPCTAVTGLAPRTRPGAPGRVAGGGPAGTRARLPRPRPRTRCDGTSRPTLALVPHHRAHRLPRLLPVDAPCAHRRRPGPDPLPATNRAREAAGTAAQPRAGGRGTGGAHRAAGRVEAQRQPQPPGDGAEVRGRPPHPPPRVGSGGRRARLRPRVRIVLGTQAGGGADRARGGPAARARRTAPVARHPPRPARPGGTQAPPAQDPQRPRGKARRRTHPLRARCRPPEGRRTADPRKHAAGACGTHRSR